MQKVALLASGPSLHKYWSEDKFDEYETVIAVNTAAWLYRCHWMAAVDDHSMLPVLSGEKPMPSIGFVTHPRWSGSIEDKGRQWRWLPGFNTVNCRWTFPNAMFFGLNLRRFYQPGEFWLDIYGFDCAVGQPDASGCTTSNHSYQRFLGELTWIKAGWDAQVTNVFSDLPVGVYHWLIGERETPSFV